MRKVVVSNLVTLDGYIAGPAGEIDWFGSVPDKEFEAFCVEFISRVDTMLFGRITYEMMAAYWPSSPPEENDPRITRAMNETAKVVFSRTLREAAWRNTRLVSDDAASEVARLKRLDGKDMVLYGSGQIVTALTRARLIDEYLIFVAPVLLGGGRPNIGALDRRVRLRPTGSRVFESGAVLLTYAPA